MMMDVDQLNEAVELLKSGDVVAAPTETVYGLFADATNDYAVQKIYQVKGRPSGNPLIIHVSGIEMAQGIAVFSEELLGLVNYFWHKAKLPLTVILPLKSSDISRFATADLDTVAIRCPSHELSRNLIEMFGGPLAAPSANTSNSISPTSYFMVKADIGHKIPLILDGGQCYVGIESTILDTTVEPYVILRHGRVTQSALENYLGRRIQSAPNAYDTTVIKAPGMMERHYSPKLPLRINAEYPVENEAFIAFGNSTHPYHFNLSTTGNLNEAARNLYYALKILDNPRRYSGIAVMPIPNQDVGVGINDRLSRASCVPPYNI
ncbi:MAG: threonylcarbamoyl-AMP synthase [Holosporales bacterium]|jgi:L-threonylcarbamoyladenylate synthase|nr:threonylcarbamoyl-AMP synthase [Holosporales bacterium]